MDKGFQHDDATSRITTEIMNLLKKIRSHNFTKSRNSVSRKK